MAQNRGLFAEKARSQGLCLTSLARADRAQRRSLSNSLWRRLSVS